MARCRIIGNEPLALCRLQWEQTGSTRSLRSCLNSGDPEARPDAGSLVKVLLRLAVPLLVTHQWWMGMTGDGVTKPADAISWTWTPRRVLVELGQAAPPAAGPTTHTSRGAGRLALVGTRTWRAAPRAALGCLGDRAP